MVKTVNAIQTNDTSNLAKKLTITQKLKKLKIKFLIITNVYSYNGFNKFSVTNFDDRLKKADLTSKNEFRQKTYFDEKLMIIDKKVSSNKKNMYRMKRNRMSYETNLN